MLCRTKFVDNRKESKLSKPEFAVGEEVKGEDAKILGALGVAVDEKEYDRIAKEKGTVPARKRKETK